MKTTNITTQTAVNSSLKPRRRIIAKKDNVIQMKESQLKQLKKAIQETGIHEFCIAGGVSANSGLRQGVAQLAEKTKSKAFLPAFEYCTDNAAMIAWAGIERFRLGFSDGLDFEPRARWPLRLAPPRCWPRR